IVACLAALADHAGAVVAVPCAHTVKRAGPGELVDATVPREGLWLAQTPQGLRRDLALAAFQRAAAEGWMVSDDVQVLERAGHRVALVRGDACNLKITTPDDLVLAEAILASRR
nr:2-C-methyl-D-erythritol 4-phosphate cytidylyltransferase [Planctomycetota bacterium]